MQRRCSGDAAEMQGRLHLEVEVAHASPVAEVQRLDERDDESRGGRFAQHAAGLCAQVPA